ncbi:MAG: polyphosphate polymerase domain-containing protein [Bacteroidia bacterium]
MRFERKYRITGKTRETVLQLVRMHPAGFRVLFPGRQINNIYFDTPSLSALNQNVHGIDERKKFRLRWYGEDPSKIRDAKLEVKIKHNELGRKELVDFPDAELTDLKTITTQVNKLLYPQAQLQPVLLSSYRRDYFISADQKFRLTVDYEMKYHSLLVSPRFSGYRVGDPVIVVELKYSEAEDGLVEFITQNIPFRQEKHSKYVNGVFMTNG